MKRQRAFSKSPWALLSMPLHCLAFFLPSSYKVGPVVKKASCAVISGLSIYPTFPPRESQCNDASWNKPWADWAAGHPGLDWAPWTGKVYSPHALPARRVRGSRGLWAPSLWLCPSGLRHGAGEGKIWLTGYRWVAFKKTVSCPFSLKWGAGPCLSWKPGWACGQRHFSLYMYPLSYQWNFSYWFQKLEIKS